MPKKSIIFFIISFLVVGGSLFLWVTRVNAASSVTITTPATDQSLPTGSFTVSGTASSDKAVTVKIDGNTVGTTLATGGNWSLNVSGVSAGSHSLSAQVSDGPFAYITNFTSDSVSVVDTNSNTVTTTIPVSTGAVGVAYSPDRSRVYTTGFSVSDNVAVIDTATNTVIATIPIPDYPTGIAVSPDGSKAYVTSYMSNIVSVVNLSNNTVSGTITVGDSPAGVVFSPNGNRAYISNAASIDVSVIDTANDSVVATVTLGSGQPFGLDTNGDGTRLYVAHTSYIAIVDTANNTVLSDLPTCANVQNMAHSKTSARLVTACFDNDDIAVYDTTNDANTQIGSNLALANDPFGIDFSRLNSNIAYITEGGMGVGNTVHVVDITGPSEVSSFTVGGAPISFGRFILPAATATAAVDFTVVTTGGNTDGDQTTIATLPQVGMLFAGPISLAILSTAGFVYYDYRRHRHALQIDYVDIRPTYTLQNHIRRVTIPVIRYRWHERFG